MVQDISRREPWPRDIRQSSSSRYPIKAKIDPQGYGSAVTYGRRYDLAARIGLAVNGEDDVANAAADKSGSPNGQKPTRSEPPLIMPNGAQRRKFHALGKQVYGEEWDAKRKDLVAAVTTDRDDGPAESSTVLTRLVCELIPNIDSLVACRLQCLYSSRWRTHQQT
jgi:hypothetical protein